MELGILIESSKLVRLYIGSVHKDYSGLNLFDWGSKTYLMGILNTTPDSFSNDGVYLDVDLAVEKGIQMLAHGADILDVGGESNRPSSIYGEVDKISVDEELDRVIPTIYALAKQANCLLSIDTYKSKVAEAAIAAGAHMVNDIWGLSKDPEMATLIADTGVYVVLMHNAEESEYGDVVSDTLDFLKAQVGFAVDNGIHQDKIIIDPGIGFSKGTTENLEILNRLGEYKKIGLPLLVGTSRKATIGQVLDLSVDDRIEGTAATVAVAITRGADMVRVHDVKEMNRVSKMTDAIVRGDRH